MNKLSAFNKAILLILGLIFFSCEGEEGTPGSDGEPGEDGESGLTSLIATTVLEEGDEDCSLGGIKIETGLDSDGSGTLDETEVTSTELICNADSNSEYLLTIVGDITNEEAQAIIDTEAGANITIVKVLGTSTVTSLDFSGLAELDEVIIADNQDLETITFSDLEITYGLVDFYDNSSLSTINFPNLEITYGNFYITGDPLTTLDVAKLQKTVGEIEISDAEMTSLNFPALVEASYLSLQENLLLTDISFPELSLVEDFYIRYNSSLTDISLPKLSLAENIYITSNSLTDISLPVFSSVGDDYSVIDFSDNQFSSSTVDELLEIFVNLDPIIVDNYINVEQSPSAPPSADGLANIDILEENGNRVNYDSE